MNSDKVAFAQSPKWIEVFVRDFTQAENILVLCPDQYTADKVAKGLNLLFKLEGARAWAKQFLDDSETGSEPESK